MSSIPRIGKAIESFGTPSSFDQELRDLLWARCTKALFIGLAVTLIMATLYSALFRSPPQVIPSFSLMKLLFHFGLPLPFALALAALYILRQRACLMKIQLITFLVFALNIILVTVNQLSCTPDHPNYYALALLLFVPAAFIPWKTHNQTSLGIVAILSVILTQWLSYAFVPEIREFWRVRAAEQSFGSVMILNAVGITILAGVARAISKTLYSLNRTTHQMKRLGNYIIEDEIGRGGMGRVLLAKHALMCRPSAVKIMDVAEGEAEAALIRFEREVHLAAHLTHPNTIQIYDFGRTPQNVFYYAMEYLSGMDLQRLVERFGPLPPRRTVFILRQICGSLAEAHAREIIHRDIKPSNIFLTERGGLHDFVKVLDFGLAKRVESGDVSAVTKTGVVFGTPRYISPEALYGTEGVGTRTDLYNVGGVAYWLLTGQPPFSTASNIDLIIDQIKTVPAKPSELCETPIPPGLDEIVMRCLEKKPEDRYQSANELDEALRALHIDDAWDWKRAKEWWELHGLAEDAVPTCL